MTIHTVKGLEIDEWVARAEAAEAERDEALADLTVFATCLKHSEVRAEASEAELASSEAQVDGAELRCMAAQTDNARLRVNALLAVSTLDWCVGYLNGYDQDTNEHVIRGKLIEARAALADKEGT